MPCSYCSREIAGAYCPECGRPLRHISLRDCRTIAAVRDHESTAVLIDRLRAGRQWFTSQQMLGSVDTALRLTGTQVLVPLSVAGAAGREFWRLLGVKTVAEREAAVRLPFGSAAALCLAYLASKRMTLERATDVADGSLIEAVVPRSMWTWEGRIRIAIRAAETTTHLSSCVEFSGQSGDYGTGTNLLAGLDEFLREHARTLD